jgi:hypothetical protein
VESKTKIQQSQGRKEDIQRGTRDIPDLKGNEMIIHVDRGCERIWSRGGFGVVGKFRVDELVEKRCFANTTVGDEKGTEEGIVRNIHLKMFEWNRSYSTADDSLSAELKGKGSVDVTIVMMNDGIFIGQNVWFEDVLVSKKREVFN